MERDATKPPERWDFCFCRVDDAPASIFLNLGLRPVVPIAGSDTVYWVDIAMLAPGDHGIGTRSEAEQAQPIEDRLVEELALIGLQAVGRVRNFGTWRPVFYGPSGREVRLHAIASATLDGAGRNWSVGSQEDTEWSYYREFLYPDSERLQWISNRRLVDQLRKHGDVHSTPREVDHWMYFASESARDACRQQAELDGFRERGPTEPGPGAPLPFGLHLLRDDPVDLDHIHAVVMTLVELARAHGDDYDGWETSVERA